MHWLRIKLFKYSDITSADLGIVVSFAGLLLHLWNCPEAIEEGPRSAIRSPQVICELQPLAP